MLVHSSPGLDDEPLCALYQMATSGDDEDQINMSLIVFELRRLGIELKHKPGKGSMGDGVGTTDDIKAATTALTVLSFLDGKSKPPKKEYRFASKWKKVGMASRAIDVLTDLEVLRAPPSP